MTEQFSIAPPSELVLQWIGEYFGCTAGGELSDSEKFLTARAAQWGAKWGADRELEACRMEIIDGAGLFFIDEASDRVRFAEEIRLVRRPKPPSLKEQALAVLERYEAEEWCEEMTFDNSIIRRALEQLDD